MKADQFRRWVPLLGVVYVTALVFSEAFGLTSMHQTLKALGGVIDLGGYSPVSAAELAAAVAAAAGIVLKVRAEIEKVKGPKPPAALILLALLPSNAGAQEASLNCGAMQFAERGQPDKRDFVCRISASLSAPAATTVFARVDYTRNQDGGDLLDVKTFRSVETFLGARKVIAPNLSVMGFSGVTWDRDADIQPSDPRLWTLAGALRYDVPGRGHVTAGAGHHGPVGGAAFLGSVVYQLSDSAAWFGDLAVPLDASRFQARPYTIKAGVSARLKGWKF